MKSALAEIQELIDKLSVQIQVPNYFLPTYNSNTEGTHFEIDKSGLLWYFATERGKENFRYLAKDLDDLLYKVFEGATLMMASNYELKNRIKGQDFRRVMFQEQKRLLNVLNHNWELRRVLEIEDILSKHPFDDNASDRVTYYKQLVKNGQHLGNEWALAFEKYPVLNKK